MLSGHYDNAFSNKIYHKNKYTFCENAESVGVLFLYHWNAVPSGAVLKASSPNNITGSRMLSRVGAQCVEMTCYNQCWGE